VCLLQQFAYSLVAVVRNVEAFQVFENYFLASESEEMKQQVIDCIAAIYNAHEMNFRLVQHLHTIAHFIEDLPNQRESLRESVLRLLVFTVTALDCVPFHELVALSCLLLETPVLYDQPLVASIHATVLVLIKYDAQFRAVLAQAGMLDALITLLRRYHLHAEESHRARTPPDTLTQAQPSSALSAHRASIQLLPLAVGPSYSLLMQMLTLLLENNVANLKVFRQRDCVRLLHFMVAHHPLARPAALRVLTQIISEERNKNHHEVNQLVEILQTTEDLDLRKDVLEAFTHLFISNPETKTTFRDSGGFVGILSALFTLEGSSYFYFLP